MPGNLNQVVSAWSTKSRKNVSKVFDHLFDQNGDQLMVYVVVKEYIDVLWSGRDAEIMGYGGSGVRKTHNIGIDKQTKEPIWGKLRELSGIYSTEFRILPILDV